LAQAYQVLPLIELFHILMSFHNAVSFVEDAHGVLPDFRSASKSLALQHPLPQERGRSEVQGQRRERPPRMCLGGWRGLRLVEI